MAKGKMKSSRPMVFAKGGNTKMFGKQSAGPQKPGMTYSAGRGGGKFAKGGGMRMFGQQSAKPSKKQ